MVYSQWLPGYQYRKQIDLQNSQWSGGPHTDFPVLIVLSADTDIDGKAQSDGYDIVFTDSDGETMLSHEMEFYDDSGAGSDYRAWVSVDLPSGVDKTIYIYYDNVNIIGTDPSTSDTWNSGYQAVWHMDDDPNGDPIGGIIDATSNSNNGSVSGSMTSSDLVTGQNGFGSAIEFDGSDDFITVPNSTSLNITGNQLTLEAWVYAPTPNADDSPFIVKGVSDNQEHYMLGIDGGVNPGRINTRITTNSGYHRDDQGSIPNNTWTHTVFTYDGTLLAADQKTTYENGFTSFTANADGDNLVSTAGGVNIARRLIGNRYFEGRLDELRVSNVVRSSDWIESVYNNQSNPTPGGFYTLGAEDATCATLPTITGTPASASLCSGDLVDISMGGTATQYDFSVVYSTNVSGSGPGSGSGIAAGTNLQETLTYTGFTSGTATYTIVPSDGTCKGDPEIVVITVNPLPSDLGIAATTATNICTNETVTLRITGSEGGVNYEIQDQASNPVSSVFGGTGSNLDITTNALAASVTSLKVVGTYPSSSCVLTMTATVAVTVQPALTAPTISASAAQVCQPGSITLTATAGFTEYDWYLDGVLNQTTTGSDNDIVLSLVAESGSWTAAGRNTAPVSCTSVQGASTSIAIDPLPNDVTLAGGPAGTADVCYGEGYSITVESSQTGVNYQLQVDAANDGSAVAGTGGDIVLTSSSLTTAGARAFTVIATNVTTSCVRTLSNSYTVTVQPALTAPTISASAAQVCQPGSITLTATAGFTEYDWYLDGVLNQTTTGSDNDIVLSLVAESGSWTAAGRNTAPVSCTSVQGASTSIAIDPLPNDVTLAGGPAGTADVCYGEGYSITVESSQTGVNYQLQVDAANDGSAVAGTGGDIVLTSSSLTTAGARAFTVIATNVTTSCVRTLSNSYTVTVQPALTAPTISASAAQVCQPGSITLTATAGFTEYDWYLDGVLNQTTTGSDNDIVLSLVAESGSWTAAGRNTAPVSCTSVQGASTSIAIDPLPNDVTLAGGPAGTADVCYGEGYSITVESSQTGVNYQLQVDAANDGSAVAGTGGDIVLTSSSLTTAGARAFTVIATNVTTSCVRTLSNSYTVTVQPALTAPTISASAAQVCQPGSITLTATAGFTEYDWYLDGVLNQTTTGSDNDIVLSLVAESGSWTAAGRNTAPVSCTSVQGASTSIAIDPLPNDVTLAGGPAGTADVCYGEGYSITVESSQTGVNYQLQVDAANDGSAVAGTGGDIVLTSSSLTTAGARAFTVIATNVTTSCVRTLSNSYTVTVQPALTAPTISASAAQVCQPGSITLTATAGFTEYDWYLDGVLNQTTTGSDNDIVLSLVAESGSWTAAGRNTAPVSCTSVQGASTSIAIDPLPNDVTLAGGPAGTADVCYGEGYSITVESSQTGVNYQLQVDAANDGSAVAGTGGDIVLTSSSLTTAGARAFTVIATNVTTSCVRTLSNSYTVTVQPALTAPTISASAAQVCQPGSITLTATAGFTEYDWYLDGVLNQTTTGSDNDIVLSLVAESGSWTAAGRNTAPVSCTSVQGASTSIAIDPLPNDVTLAGGPAGTADVCYGEGYSITVESSQTGVNYQLQVDAANDGSAVAGTGGDIVLTSSSLTTAGARAFTVIATNVTTSCVRTLSNSYTVTVQPALTAPTISASAAQVCQPGSITLTATAGFTEYDWYLDGVLNQTTTGSDNDIVLSLVAESGSWTAAGRNTAPVSCTSVQGASTSIAIDPLPNDVTLAGGPAGTADVCYGEGYSITVESSQTGVNYQLQVDAANDGSAVAGTGGDIVLTSSSLTTAGARAFTVIATNVTTSCVRTLSNSYTVTVQPALTAPTISASAAQVCQPGSITLTATAGFTEYDWYLDGVLNQTTTGSDNDIVLSLVAESGSWTAAGRNTAPVSCTSVQGASTSIAIDPLPNDVTLAGGPAGTADVCYGEGYSITVESSQTGVNYQLQVDAANDGSAVAGTGGDIVLTSSSLTTAGARAFTVIATNVTTSCVRTLSNSYTVTVQPALTAPTISASAAQVCQPGSITLTATAGFTEYDWYLDGVLNQTTTGSDNDIVLSLVAESGSWTAAGRNTAPVSCTSVQGASTSIAIDPLPNDVTLAGGPAGTADVCYGEGYSITVESSQTGVNYQLQVDAANDGSAVAGTGGDIVLTSSSLTTAGARAFTVIATNVTTSCVRTLSNSYTVTVQPALTAPTISASAAQVCQPGSITLTATAGFTEYDWYLDGVLNQTTTGSDNDIVLSLVAESGSWTAAGRNTAPVSCTSVQGASTSIAIDPLPNDVTLAGGPAGTADVCYGEGYSITVESSQTGVNYQLQVDAANDGSAVAGTGGDIVLTSSSLTTAGARAFTVIATNVTTSCVRTLSNSYTVTVQPALTAPTISASAAQVCQPGSITLTATAGFTEYDWYLDGVLNQTTTGSDNDIVLSLVAESGSWTAAGRNTAPVSCTSVQGASTSIAIDPLPNDVTLAGGPAGTADVCYGEGYSITVESSQTGVNYQLQVDAANDGSAVAGTGGDIVLTSSSLTTAGARAFTVIATNVTTSCVRTLSNSYTVTVQPALTAPTISASAAQVCQPGSITLTATAGFTEYDWYLDGVLNQTTTGSDNDIVLSLVAESGSWTAAGRNTAPVSCTSVQGASTSIAIDPLPNDVTLAGGPAGTADVCYGEGYSITVESSQTGVNYQLQVDAANDGSAVAGTGGDIVLTSSSLTTAGARAFTVIATNVTTSCVRTLSNSYTVTVQPALTAPTISASAAQVCQPGSITLTATAGFTEYDWYLDGVLNQTTTGSDNDIVLSLVAESGSWTAAGRNTAPVSCTSVQGASTSIAIDPLPNDVTLAGGPAGTADVCYGEGYSITVESSQTGVNYQLQVDAANDGSAVAGTGGDIVLTSSSLTTAGARAFTVIATNVTTSCVRTLSNSYTVTVQPALTAPTISASAAQVCQPGSITLTATAGFTEYDWYLDGVLNQTTTGSDNDIVLSLVAESGSWTAAGRNTAPVSCTSVQGASTSIAIDPLPNDVTLAGGPAGTADVCYGEGYSITVESSQTGVNYQLQVDAANDGSAVAGTGGDIVLTSSSLTTAGARAFTVIADECNDKLR
jgi:hypothetical protein